MSKEKPTDDPRQRTDSKKLLQAAHRNWEVISEGPNAESIRTSWAPQRGQTSSSDDVSAEVCRSRPAEPPTDVTARISALPSGLTIPTWSLPCNTDTACLGINSALGS